MIGNPLRMACVGVGANVYGMHKKGLALPTNQIVGLCDHRAEVEAQVKDDFDVPFYTDYTQMLEETKPEVVVVMVPHYDHPKLTIQALQAGCHVLVEKPMANEVKDADAMITAAQHTGKILAINFQQRTRPEIVKAKELIESGVLGTIQQLDVQMSWTRTALYYTLVDWRGTWKGEGGGVLMNQAPHELDLICHLVGMPKQVFAWTRKIIHHIETEDTVHAILEWDNGALGTVHISTAEAGRSQSFEITGTGGHLQVKKGGLTLKTFDTPVDQFIRTSEKPFAAPQVEEQSVEITGIGGDHTAIYTNLYEVIRNGATLVADPESSIRGLELANAMNYSSHTNQPVHFPLNREAYSKLLSDLIASAHQSRKGA